MAWHARLQIDYTRAGARTVARHLHSGPLRLLQSLYPEGDAVCHNVLVHPPGGLVGGDTLELSVTAAAQAHGLLTTPGASRFYRSSGETAIQHTRIQLDEAARLEWLPQEAICYSGCRAENRLELALAPGAELIGWDVAALGLPAAGQPFLAGSLVQHLSLDGAWLERGRIDAADRRLLESRLGLDGQRCMASLFWCAGSALQRQRVQQALESARGLIEAHALHASAGATCPNDRLVLVRVLAPMVEPAMALLRQVRNAWRQALWQLPAVNPRVWST